MSGLRKIVAYFLGVFLVFALGYQLMDPSFLLIADWLGPLFGSPLLVALMSIFLLLGDPLRFTVLLAIWGGVALLGGVIIRRRVSAVATMAAVYLFFLSVLAASVFDIIQTVSELGLIGGQQSPFSLLPPIPPGLTIARILEAPIVGRILEPLLGMIGTGTGVEAQRLIMDLATPLLIDFAEKLGVVCLAALAGTEVGRRIEPRFAPWSEGLRIKLGGRPGPFSAPAAARRAVLPGILSLILLSLVVSSIPSGAAAGGYFSENLLGFVDGEGRGYVAGLFLDSELPVDIDTGNPEAEGLLGALMVSQDSILDAVIDALPEGADIPEGLDVDSIRNLLPPTALVVVYLDVPSELAEEKAEAISSAFSDAFGIGLRRMIALSPPLPESDGAERAPLVSIVVYEAPDELADLSEAFIDLLPADRGGLVELMEEAHERGRLTPGVASGSPDCAAMFTGFVNLATLGEYLPLEELDRLNVSRLILPSIDAPLGLTGAVSYWKRGIQSPPGAHTFDMLRLLGVESPVSFSSDADMSNVFMIATNLTLGAGMDKGDYAVTLTTTTPLTEAVQGVAQWMTVTELPPGALVDPSHFRIDLSGVMPLNVAVSKQASPMEASRNGEVQVTVTVRNDDDHQMMEVALDDGDALLGYPTSTSVASGSTGAAWAVIHPGESKSLTYTVKLGSSGVYTLRPAAVRYVHGGKAFSQDSNPAEVRVSRPSALPFVAEAVASTWSSTSRALDGFTGGNGSSILMASTAAWAAALAFMEYRGFRKWLSGG